MDDLKINMAVSQFVEKEIKHLDEKYQLIQEKNQEALLLTSRELERRLESMNEFREQLERQSKDFLDRKEYEIKHEVLCQKIDMALRILYIGIGIVLVAEIVFKFLVK